MLKLMQCMSHAQIAVRRSIHKSSYCLAGAEWRKKRGEYFSANHYGPLIDIPDWSYADGRPAPLGTCERKRREQFKALGKRALNAMEELHMAKEMHRKKQQDQEDQQERRQPRFKSKVDR